MNTIRTVLAWGVRIFLWLSALTPLVVVPRLIQPFVFGKVILYHSAIEAALICYGLFIVLYFFDRGTDAGADRPYFGFLHHPIFLSVVALIVSAAISTLLAPDAFRAFFGDMQRGEGLLGWFHFFAFLWMALSIFSRRDWKIFFGIVSGVALIMMFFAWLQFAGNAPVYFPLSETTVTPSSTTTVFPYQLERTSQPGSFTGNAGFLSSYLLVLLLLVGVAYSMFQEWRLGRILLIACAIVALLTLFITGIRGGLIGLGAGGLWLGFSLALGNRQHRLEKRRLATAGLVIFLGILVLTGVLWQTRTAAFWQNIPGVSRLATASFSNPSVATRLMALEVSGHAFLERPLFGWGLDNFNVAYNKYYNPSYALYAEDWFDRAHDKIADLLVMQGVAGLIAYGAVLFFLGRWLWRKGGAYRTIGFAALIGYVVQNLFIFDQINTDIIFVAVLGAVIAIDGISHEHMHKQSTEQASDKKMARMQTIGIMLAGIIAVAGSAYALYAWSYVPYVEASNFDSVFRAKVGAKILAQSDSFLLPYTFVEQALRTQFVTVLYDNGLMRRDGFGPLTEKALQSLEESAKLEPFEPRVYTTLIEAYDDKAKDDAAIFTKSEGLARTALTLSPKRQQIRYLLAYILAGEKRFDEAISIARETLAYDDRIAKAHYELGLILGLSADVAPNKGTPRQLELRTEAEKEMDRARELGQNRIGSSDQYIGSDYTDSQYYLFLESDLDNMAIFYQTWGHLDKLADTLEVLTKLYPKAEYYGNLIAIYRTERDADKLIAAAKAYKELPTTDQKTKDSLDIVIDLAQKRNWTILDTVQ